MEELTLLHAVENTLYNFSKPVMLSKPTLKKYQTPNGRIIHITDYITFHEVGYYQDGQIWERCVIDEEAIKANPEYFKLID